MKPTPLLSAPCHIAAALLAALAAVCCLYLSSISAAEDPAEPLVNPQAINPGFTTDLYAQLRETEGNVFFSPYSISECMGMAYAGTGGNTAAEIAKAMSYEENSKLTAKQFKALRAQMEGSINQGENKLSVANALCVTGHVPEQDYQTLVREQYDGELFSGGLAEINGWVKKKTEGRIEEILSELSKDSACVLLNAVYFKGNWEAPFPAGSTHKAPFHVSADKKVEVEMMNDDEGHRRLLKDQGVIAVELPYQTGASMILIMPEKPEGMKALEQKLSAPMLNELCSKLQQEQQSVIDLFLPKFKIATQYNLVDPMKQLGMADAFDFDKSDFEPMYGSKKMRISQIVHKATLEVDEKGSVAAAATGLGVETLSAVFPQPEIIRFDRPFLVLIRENTTNTNLFMGRISDPRK